MGSSEEKILLKTKLKSLLNWLLRLTKKVLITVAITLLITFITSKYVDMTFPKLLEIMGFIVLGIGVVPVLGENKLNKDVNYNLTRMMMNSDIQFKEKFDLMNDRFDFIIFMSISGLIILLISRILY